MRKYFSFLVIICVMCCMVLTGCNLFERDNAKYLAQIVAKTKEEHSIEVTMEDLLIGYNNWGSSYFDQNSDPEEATKQIINDIIDKKYMLRYFDENFSLEEKEIWKAYQDTYDYINEQIAELEETIKIEWKWSTSGGDNNESSSDDKDTSKIYTPYKSQFKLDNQGNIVFNDLDEDNTVYPTENPTFVYTSIGAIETAEKDNKRLFEEAKNRYFNNLKDNYESRGITKSKKQSADDFNKKLLDLEIERVYKVNIENAKITKLQNHFNNVIKREPTELEEVLNAVYEEFRNKFNEQKQFYDNASNIESYRKDILDSSRSKTFYYNPITTSGEFFNVTHLLLKFSDETQAKLDKAKELAENGGGTYENYQALLRSSYQTIKVQAINPETGKPEGEYKSVADILGEIEAVTSNGKVDLEDFRKIQFKYQGDTAVYTSTYDYVIPMDSSRDTMVKPFADKSRELRGNGSAENIGKVSGLVESEYGYHIIIYTGEVTNIVSSIENKEAVLKQLFNTRVKADRNKTYFDLVYESISSNLKSFNTWSEDIVKTYRNGVDIKLYPYRYKKLYE